MRCYLAEALSRTMQRMAHETIVRFRTDLQNEFAKVLNYSQTDMRLRAEKEREYVDMLTNNNDNLSKDCLCELVNANIDILEEFCPLGIKIDDIYDGNPRTGFPENYC
jgi:hypothetical protein